MQYLSALVSYLQRRAEGKGGIISVKTRHICGEDRRCVRAVNSLMMSLTERGLGKCHKRGVYLIEKKAVEEVLKILKRQVSSRPPGGLRNRRSSAASTRRRRGGARRAAE